jgi:uncharacterized protein
MKLFLWTVKILVVSYFLFALILYFFQRRFLYFPQKNAGVVSAKKLEVRNGETVLRGWVINEGKENAILYYGGNAESIEYNIPFFKDIFDKYTVYLLNYRGYGMSDGTPTEPVLHKDAIHIYDEINDKHNKISLIGRSLGTAVATYVASKRHVDRLVLITPFDSISKVAQQIYWMYPMFLLLKDKFESDRCIKDITAETMIIAAENDEVIPRKRTEALISKFKPEKLTVKIIKGTGHNSISMSPEFSRDLIIFFDISANLNKNSND